MEHGNTEGEHLLRQKKLVQLLGDLLFGKIDARSAYESLQADNHKTKKEANHQASPSALTDLQRSVATADSAKYATRRTANQQKAQAAKSESVSLTSKLNTADQDYVDGVADKDNSTTSGFADKAAEANKSVGGARADLGKDIGKANITRGKEDIDVAITHRNDLIQAEIDHISRVQTAKVTQAEKVGQANKDLHIAGYTQAATQTANGLIADAQTEFNTKAKDSRVLRAGDIGDAAITAAESLKGNATRQAGSWNTATEQYTNTSNSAATTWTTGTNTLSESYAQSVTTHGADWDIKVVKAYRDALVDSGTSDVSWITTLTNADATRTGAQATAQASWVTNQVQGGASSLLWSGGDSTSTNASGTWVTQYAPVRTAKIVATSLIDAARTVASWFDSKEETNKQANADVKFVEDVKDPNTQVATSLTQREGAAMASANTSGTDLSKDMDSSQRRIRNAVVSIESTRAIDEAKAQKKRDVALAGLAEGASTTAVDKTYQDDMAKALFAWQQGYANLTYDEGSEQLKAVTETITEFGQAGKKYVEDTAGDEKLYTDALAPLIGTRTVSYIQAGIALLKASTGADNIWRNNTAQAWATHTGGDLTARGNTQRGVANASSLLADASRASIAEHKAQWWQTEIPNYLQWSADVGAIETTYTDDTTDNILQRAIGVKNAGVKYATDVGIAIKDYDVNTAAAREEYIRSLMTIAKSIGDKLLDAQRDKEIALADAELQKQLTGNQSAYTSAVEAANTAYTNTTNSEVASRKSQEQTALSTMNTKLSNELKNKDADIAAAEREYDQTVASLDAQYGSESSNGDTGVEGATRRSAIKTRDAQYYAARDTSWANTLSGSTTLGTTPWTLKAISAANGQAAYSTSRASAQAAHDAAMLDAIEDWQLTSRESLTDLLFTEGQSRETYNVATSNVYANWENGTGNLLGGKPEGTGWGDGFKATDEDNPPSNGTTATGPGAAIAWEPEEPPENGQEIPEDGNVFSLPNRPSPEQLKPLYDHFGKERAEEIIEIRWPSKPYPESKYSMSAYQPSAEELLAQRLPGYWRLRELIELSEAGALNGRGRDEMKALAAEFNFHWRMANGSDGSLFSTLNMWAGLTVAGQNPTMNQLMSSLSSMAAVRPTPVRPNLRLEIKPRYTQQPVTSAPRTFTTKPTSERPSPKFKIQPVAPPAPLDKVQTAAPKPKVDVSKYRQINLGSKGEADQPDMLHLNIDLNEITREISGGKIAANYTSMPEIPSSHFEVIRGRNVQFGKPSEIVPTMKEIFRIAKPGGTINISFTSNWDEVERALKEAGFVNVKRGARTYPFGLLFTAEKPN